MSCWHRGGPWQAGPCWRGCYPDPSRARLEYFGDPPIRGPRDRREEIDRTPAEALQDRVEELRLELERVESALETLRARGDGPEAGS